MDKPAIGVTRYAEVDFNALAPLYAFYRQPGDGGEERPPSPDYEWVSDAPWVLGADGKWGSPSASFLARVGKTGEVHVVKSPVVGRHGPCTPPHCGRADLSAEGDILCYDLPEVMRWTPL